VFKDDGQFYFFLTKNSNILLLKDHEYKAFTSQIKYKVLQKPIDSFLCLIFFGVNFFKVSKIFLIQDN